MRLISLLSIALILCIQSINAQSPFKRIKVNNASQQTINTLLEQGIDLKCGAVFTNNSIQLEVSNAELERLNNVGINYTIEIEDLVKFYDDRITQNIEIARSQLTIEKATTASIQNIGESKPNEVLGRSVVSTALDNFLQYDECDEVDWVTPQNFNLNPNPSPNSFGGCLTVDQVEAELDQMRALFPNLVSIKMDASPTGERTNGNTLGTATFPGQTVYYVRISDNPDIDEANEPEILYTSMIHSREVSSLMGNLFFMWYVLENYATDPAIRNLVDNNELYFIPVVNPDGLRWNEIIAPNGGGLQRKNLRVNSGDSGSTSSGNTSRGVDLNRNFDYLFGSAGDPSGSSGTTTSQSYRGPSAFSEPESRILRDFVLSRNFETALMHHSTGNAIPHPYGGIPSQVSGREDEMHKWHEDMTRFNRYVSGATIFTPANGIADDWMLGGTTDGNGSVGSGRNILASTPENGIEGGFWPNPVDIVPIAKRMMRINLMSAYHGGQYAKLNDLTQSNITSLTSDLDFGIERIGQTPSDYTLTVTPVSSNITSIGSIATQSGMTILEQRNVSAQLQLDPSIQPNDKIEYNVQLSNGSGVVFYDANFEKIYQPDVLFSDNPDVDGLSNWTVSGGNWITSSTNPFSGSTAIKSGATVPYANNVNSTLTSANTFDFSASSEVIIQYYTRWDLERNFDFVEIEGSTNGSTWLPLCGIFNKPEATFSTNDHAAKSSTDESFQSNSSGRVYDGDQMNKWVMEEIVIDATNNSFLLGATNAQIRFRFRTDSNNRPENYSTDYSGFFFDDFTIIGMSVPCDASNPPSNIVANNVTSSSATIDWDSVASATYDLRYRVVGAQNWITVSDLATNTFNISGLAFSTTYEVQVSTRCDTTISSFSSSIQFTTQDNILSAGFFETGLDGWIDGGTDVARVQSSNSSEGLFSIRIRDNSGTASAMTSPVIDATGFDSLEINFTYFPTSMESGEDFFVEFFDGSSYTIIESFRSGIEFSNNSFFNASVTVDASSFNFASNSRFRIRCDAGANNDQVFVDEVIITGISSTPDTIPPVITLNGSTPVDINLGDAYTELGATAVDDIDGDISSNVVVGGDTVDTNSAGTYVVTYNVSDAAGNAATEVTRTVNVIPDTTPPVITLNGSSPVDINIGGTYTELGAMAIDDIDGDISSNVVIGGDTVDTNSAGTYVVTYNVSDASGNAATEVTRTVNVIPDTTPPVITLNGSTPVDINVGGTYTELGATAVDDIDGDISGNIIIGGDSVDTNSAGTYVVTYNVSDAAGNAATEVTRTVNVIPDTTPPVITLNGSTPVDINVGGTYTELGATAIDNIDGDISSNVVIGGDTVDTNSAGTYIVTYNVNDAAGNAATEVTRTVNVIPDTTPPVITLNGSTPVDINIGGTYTELGATAVDDIDGDISGNIIIGGDTVDTNSAGTYIVTYNVNDAAGNAATEVTRTVNVIPDTTPPVITLNGSTPVDLNVGDTYTELGATAIDDIDGDISSSVVIGGDTVDTNSAGTYIVTYNVSDTAGNSATEVTRTVNVNDIPQDVILSQGFFETGLDGWIDGGGDVARVQTTASFEGLFSIRIRDNSGAASTMTSPIVDLTPFNQAEISFYMLTSNFSTGENVLVQYFNGSTWITIGDFLANSDFFNGSFYFASITVSSAQFNFATNSRFRIRCDASNNRDQAFIDQVIITGINSAARSSTDTKPIIASHIEFVKSGPQNLDLIGELDIYPNPVKGAFLNVTLSREEAIDYNIYDLLGKRILSGKTSDKINVSRLQNGVYIIELNDGEDIIRKRFIKE